VIRAIKYFLMLFIAVIVGGFAYLMFTYIDETVTEDNAYGFYIGESKSETYKRARDLYSSQKTSILHPLNKYGGGPYKQISFTDSEYGLLKDRNLWEIYFDDGGYSDVIKLTFDSNKLVSIYRHRQHFELP